MDREALLGLPPYGLDRGEKAALYREELAGLTRLHRAGCGEYRRLLEALGVPEGKQVGALLQALLGGVLDGETPNERGALLARAQLFMDF